MIKLISFLCVFSFVPSAFSGTSHLSLVPLLLGGLPNVESVGYRDSNSDEYRDFVTKIRTAVKAQSELNRANDSEKQGFESLLTTPGKKLSFPVDCQERQWEFDGGRLKHKGEKYYSYKAEIVAETTQDEDTGKLSTTFSFSNSSSRWKKDQILANGSFTTTDKHEIEETRSFNPVVKQSGAYYDLTPRPSTNLDSPYEVKMESVSAGKDGNRAFTIHSQKNVKRFLKDETQRDHDIISRNSDIICW